MEKFTFNNVLALLLPGLFVLFCIQLTGWSLPIAYSFSLHNFMNIYKDNDFLNSVFYILLAIVSGSVIQKITVWAINQKWYNRLCGLYLPTSQIFLKDKALPDWMRFFNDDCKKIFDVKYDGSSLLTEKNEGKRRKIINDTQGKYFDYIYYFLMSKGKLEETRTEQNFYYMFRNLFTISFFMGLICIAIFFVISIIHGWKAALNNGILAFCFLLFGFMICRTLGKWYRKRMVHRSFYLYYIEKSTTII